MKSKDYRLAKTLEAVKEDWITTIDMSSEYFEHLVSESKSQGLIERDLLQELREAWRELKLYEDMYDYYKQLLVQGKTDEALSFSEQVLFASELSFERGKTVYLEHLQQDSLHD